MIPRSVAVNSKAEAEYISRRRNEVSVLVNKQRWTARVRRRSPGRQRNPIRLQEFYFHDKHHVLINSHLRYWDIAGDASVVISRESLLLASYRSVQTRHFVTREWDIKIKNNT